MTVRELFDILDKFPPEYTITISDGYRNQFYTLDKAVFTPIKESDDTISIDIGIGGCSE